MADLSAGLTSYISIFLVSFTIALSGALMPGPLLTTVIAESAKHGFKSGPLLIAGHAILEVLTVGLIVLGFTGFASNTAVMRSIAAIGSLVLFYFGLTMILSLPKLSLNDKKSPTKAGNLVLLGVTVSVSNPYFAFWWLTVGLGLVLAAQKQGFPALLLFFLGHISADLSWYSFVSWGVSRSRKLISENVYRRIILACALALIGFSAYFGLTAFHTR